MKNILSLFFIFSIACHSGSVYPWYKGSLDELRAITGSKPIMMEFYTDS
tara:strand:+ start:1524 stop:1670 length:147 start_codon:yes stop_codon:yes gene_type:complete